MKMRESNLMKALKKTLNKVVNVLIADDDAQMRQLWQKLIEENGGRVVHSAGSADAVEGDKTLDYGSIDAAIVDYKFEGEDKTGIDLIAHLKRQGVKRVFLCTGFHDDEEIKRQAKQAGADAVIAKPLDENQLSHLLAFSFSEHT